MTQQKNLFYSDPDLTEIRSSIIGVRPHAFGTAVALDQNIVRAAGGGEPRDVGAIGEMPIRSVEKQDGMTWIAFEDRQDRYSVGDVVNLRVDAGHRDSRRRLHTGVHLAIRCAYNHFGDIRITEAEIAEDAISARVVGKVDRPVDKADVGFVDRAMRSAVLKAYPVTSINAKSVEHAEREFGALFRVSDRHAFKGKVRLVCMDNLDVNPCGGLHHPDTNIGAYEMKADLTNAARGVFDIKINLAQCWMYWYGD
jgi:Ser-tRNA(Ala) deacylase AlaX